MPTIKIEKDIFVKDEYNVERRVWVAGNEVETYVYNAILKTNKVVNPEDLPVAPNSEVTSPSLHNNTLETKELPANEPTLAEQMAEEPVKEAEVKPQAKVTKKKK